MVNKQARISDAIEEYLASCSSHGDRPATLRNKRCALDRLLNDRYTGNLIIRNLTARHMDSVFETMHQSGLAASSMNTYRGVYTHFFDWCRNRRYLPAASNPMHGTRTLKTVPRDRVMVPAVKFGVLLDAAEHPRDRAVVALGLYLFLRQSELRTLTIGDIDLDGGWVDVKIHKTAQRDRMPISLELDRELRAWLTWYANSAGSLDPSWSLIPGRERSVMTGTPGRRGLTQRVPGDPGLRPTQPLRQIERPVQAALVGAGFNIKDVNGKANFEGMHTLRRSGARARFDMLASSGYDGALREVQAMLHHASSVMTETYLGLKLDVQRRDTNIRGVLMFPDRPDATVSTLKAVQ